MGDTGKTCTACLPTGRQDPNDEPASVLLEKIRQEKERMIKEKKIKRDKNVSIIYRGDDNSYYHHICILFFTDRLVQILDFGEVSPDR